MFALFLAVALALPAPASRYTVTVYAYAVPGRGPAWTHTFATFTRGGESLCISWMPNAPKAKGNVRLTSRPECGCNWSLAQTLEHAREIRAKVHAFGPYPCRPELFEAAQRRVRELESGQIAYKAIDVLTRPKGVNCIHAVSDTISPPLDTGVLVSDAAAREIVRHFRPYLVKP